ncbi:hypothetical protein KEJ26_06295 [Candidatus Bathyarchaeota archaeon]|nr:hypothetical protein [Candidatus Bathyarchaeota archaeon]
MSAWLLGLAMPFLTGLFITFATTPFAAKKAGITGVDIHKLTKPVIPEMGGIGIVTGLAAAVGVSYILIPTAGLKFATFLFTALIAGGVGVIDDLYTLGPRVKTLLTAITCLPIFLLGTYNPHPYLPFIGPIRLTIVYPFLLPFAVAVPANAVNMMDVLNGAMPATCSIVIGTLLICSILLNQYETAAMCAALLGCLLAFYYYNRYPARFFSGDVGSLTIGASIGALALIGRMEVVTIVALLPFIMNAFYGLASVGRLYEHKEIVSRPILVLETGQLAANTDPNAPITLTRIILAASPLREQEVVRNLAVLTLVSSFLALITTAFVLMRVSP